MTLLSLLLACVVPSPAEDSAHPEGTYTWHVLLYTPGRDCIEPDGTLVVDARYWQDQTTGDFPDIEPSRVPFDDGRCAWVGEYVMSTVTNDPAVCVDDACFDHCDALKDSLPYCD